MSKDEIVGLGTIFRLTTWYDAHRKFFFQPEQGDCLVTPCPRELIDQRLDENPHARADWCAWEFGGFHVDLRFPAPMSFGCVNTVADDFGARITRCGIFLLPRKACG